jgi:MarR family transcriptional regulator, organic hydroperoxide resistance regulator
MFRISRTARFIAQQLEEQLDLSTPQMRILFEALEPEGVSQAVLCKQYQVDPASITRTVQAMERDGLVTRHVDESDNRYMRVYATEKGRILAESLPAKIASFEQHLVEGLSDDEILMLHTLLERLGMQIKGEAS